MDFSLEPVISVALGVGLAAATGFRIFLPLLVAGLAARTGLLSLSDGFQWLSGTPALLMLGTAATVETLAYYIPGVDHALDLVAGPAAIAAGIVASASVMTDMPHALLWPLAIIAGGGAAAVAKAGSAVLRAKSGAATAGLANPVVATFETLGAAGVAIVAVAAPLLCLAIVVLLSYWIARLTGRVLFRGSRKAGKTDS